MAEILAVYPIRSMAGNDLWRDLFACADSEIDVLVYAGFWLSEDPDVRKILAKKAASGVRLRFLFGCCQAARPIGGGRLHGPSGLLRRPLSPTAQQHRPSGHGRSPRRACS